MDFSTLCIHGNTEKYDNTGAVSVPIFQSATFAHPGVGESTGYDYTRQQNPTREHLENVIKKLEDGVDAIAFATGMAAISAVMELFSPGDHIIASDDLYGGSHRLFHHISMKNGIGFDLVNTSELSLLEGLIRPNTKALFVETPTNPMMQVTDIAAVAEIARKHGVLSIVDNTFMTPYLQRPISLGVDIVVHSATKYLGGHSDLIAGLAVVNSKELAERLWFIQNATGGVLQPFDSFLLIRGIKTLGVRMDRHIENATFITEALKSNPGVKVIYYPGLPDSQGYEINRRQADGPGGMFSFELDEQYDLNKFVESLELITLAESLGGVESLICHPSSMTHASIPYDIRQKVGIVENLIRISVGIEDKNDILADLEQAFKKSLEA